jgi:hypothetical protein
MSGYNFIGSEHEKGHDETHSLTTVKVRRALDRHGWKFEGSDRGESDGAFAERSYNHPSHPGHRMVFRRRLVGGKEWRHELNGQDVQIGDGMDEFPKYLTAFHKG